MEFGYSNLLPAIINIFDTPFASKGKKKPQTVHKTVLKALVLQENSAIMLQRIQTVYLILAFISLVLFNFFDLASFSKASQTWILTAYSFSEIDVDIPTYFLSFGGIAINLIALILLATIFQFKNRKLQIRLGHLAYFLLLILTVVLFINVSGIRDSIEASYGTLEIGYNLGMYLPVISIAFIILANKSIRKDENLVKSLDRIR